MTLIYAYIQQYKNYVGQQITFDPTYEVSFQGSILSITYRGVSAPRAILCGERNPVNLHLLVGKTGSGKTNMLQLIGSKKDSRFHRKWEGEPDSYFLLYAMGDSKFFLEICDVEIKQFPRKPVQNRGIPKDLQESAARMEQLRTVHFTAKKPLQIGEPCLEFQEIYDNAARYHEPPRCAIVNGYDIHAFIVQPYPDEREDFQDFRNDWIGRMVQPYHRASLWSVTDYIQEYLQQVEPGTGKKQVSFVLSTQNFADDYPLKLSNALEREYWTYAKRIRDENERSILGKEHKGTRKRKKDWPSNKKMFIHDLWTDYAAYLRKWIEKIRSYNAEEKIPEEYLDSSGSKDVYQEFVDYYADKEYKEDFDPSELPDGQQMPISKRCLWLAEYIDRVDNRNPHGLLWQIVDDIKDIANFLSQLDEKYFTVDTCTIPVVDMAAPKNKELFFQLFERMEQYTPDDAGIFTDQLLPYYFTHLSTGEYQYAKILGGMDDYLKYFSPKRGQPGYDVIILLDEPETYMHPELARRFISKLYEITEKFTAGNTVQVIIGTHSPFMVSDLFAEEITRLNIDPGTGNALVLGSSDKQYFGANIHTILADSFFLDYTIGEFSRGFLQDTYNRLRSSITEKQIDPVLIQAVKELAPYIGDALIRRVFENLLHEVPEYE